jgi:hypothetical protein
LNVRFLTFSYFFPAQYLFIWIHDQSNFRSFGVVLWELLSGEIPYKDVDSSAIIWGVGSNSLQRTRQAKS